MRCFCLVAVGVALSALNGCRDRDGGTERTEPPPVEPPAPRKVEPTVGPSVRIPAEAWSLDGGRVPGERAVVVGANGRITATTDGTVYELRRERGMATIIRTSKDGSTRVLARTRNVGCVAFVGGAIAYVASRKQPGDRWGHRAWIRELRLLSLDGATHFGVADQPAECSALRADAAHVYFTNQSGTWRVARQW